MEDLEGGGGEVVGIFDWRQAAECELPASGAVEGEGEEGGDVLRGVHVCEERVVGLLGGDGVEGGVGAGVGAGVGREAQAEHAGGDTVGGEGGGVYDGDFLAGDGYAGDGHGSRAEDPGEGFARGVGLVEVFIGDLGEGIVFFVGGAEVAGGGGDGGAGGFVVALEAIVYYPCVGGAGVDDALEGLRPDF